MLRLPRAWMLSIERVATLAILVAYDSQQGVHRLHLLTCSIAPSQTVNGAALGAPIALAKTPRKIPYYYFKGSRSFIFSGSNSYILTLSALPLCYSKFRRHRARRRSWPFHAPFKFPRALVPSRQRNIIIIIHIYYRVWRLGLYISKKIRVVLYSDLPGLLIILARCSKFGIVAL